MIDSPRPVNIYIYKIINPWLHFKWRRILFPYVILLENDLLEKSELRKGINFKKKDNREKKVRKIPRSKKKC